MKFSSFILLAIAAFFAGCGSSSRYGHVESFEMEAKAAPEVRGASHYQKPNTSDLRLSAHAFAGKSSKEEFGGIRNKKGDCSALADCGAEFKVNENVTGVYKTNLPYFAASIEFLDKDDYFIWSVGGAIDDGIYGFGTLGFNTRYFEAGASGGLWIFSRHYSYLAASYSCYRYNNGETEFSKGFFSEEDNGLAGAFTYGGYASLYYGDFSLGFSMNIYRPYHEKVRREKYGDSESVLQADFDMPLVMTEYISAGYRLNKHWEFRAGAVNVFGDFPGWHWGGFGGFSYYTD